MTDPLPDLSEPPAALAAAGSDNSAVDPAAVDPAEVRGALEALLLVADEPIDETALAAAVQVPEPVVRDGLAALVADYDAAGRGFELRRVAGGWRYYTRDAYADVVARHLTEGPPARLSPAALETLAVVAYTQPVSRARVAAVRGVTVDGVVRTLLARNLIAETGQDPDTGAVLFGTTPYFLERLGLAGLDDLPPLAPHLPDAGELEAELGRLADRAAQAEEETR